jgi:hypothetical protein
MLIKEDDKVIIHDKSFDNNSELIHVSHEFELIENSIMLHDEYLCCVDKIHVREDGVKIIDVYMQDALVIRDGVLFENISDSY